MKNKKNRTLVLFLLVVATMLSSAVAVIVPAVAVASEVKRVIQLEKTLVVQEKSTMYEEPVTIVEEEYEAENGQIPAYMIQEFDDRCRILHALFANESVEVQTAIMATIINREESIEFADNFYDVIATFEPFMSVIDSYTVYEIEEISIDTVSAVMDTLSYWADPTEWLLVEEAERLGLDPAEYAEGGALFFCHRDECNENELEDIKVKVQIGDYIFYKK